MYQVHSLGVNPGDSLADLIFACCFARFHKHLALELEAAGLVVMIPVVVPPFTADQPRLCKQSGSNKSWTRPGRG